MNKEYAKYLLNKTVDDYNKIAIPFSSTRSYLSDDILELKKYVENGDRVLDLGCGNGRLVQLFKDLDTKYLGLDSSDRLVEIAKKRHPDFDFRATKPIDLDLPNNSFDKIFCLSVFHHIPDDELRLQYLKEIRRVLVPEGLLILTVWDMWSRAGTFWQIIKSGIFNPRLDINDIFLPFKNGRGETLADRYIHCFTREELEDLVRQAGFKFRESAILSRGKKAENKNILVVGIK